MEKYFRRETLNLAFPGHIKTFWIGSEIMLPLNCLELRVWNSPPSRLFMFIEVVFVHLLKEFSPLIIQKEFCVLSWSGQQPQLSFLGYFGWEMRVWKKPLLYLELCAEANLVVYSRWVLMRGYMRVVLWRIVRAKQTQEGFRPSFLDPVATWPRGFVGLFADDTWKGSV